MSREHLTADANERPESSPGDLAAAFRSVAFESALLVQAAAERLGMAVTDLACLAILMEDGPATPGHLAARLGVTSGAVTGVVDRLAAQGRVRREPDPSDRRRAIVVPLTERSADVTALLSPFSGAGGSQRFDPNIATDALRRFLLDTRDMAAARLVALRSDDGAEAPTSDGTTVVARGDLDAARLKLGGLTEATQLSVTDIGDALCRVSGKGGVPSVKLRGNTLTIRVRHHLGTATCTIELSSLVEWKIEMSGGTHRGTMDLRGARLGGITLSGGTSRLEVMLPVPSGAVPIRVSGGTSHLMLRRPAGVPVALRLRGGASNVVVDGSNVRSVGGDTRLGTALGAGDSGYEVDVSGGSSHLEIA